MQTRGPADVCARLVACVTRVFARVGIWFTMRLESDCHSRATDRRGKCLRVEGPPLQSGVCKPSCPDARRSATVVCSCGSHFPGI